MELVHDVQVAATWVTCFATYELVRRVNWLRPLFGLKPLAQDPAAHTEPARA